MALLVALGQECRGMNVGYLYCVCFMLCVCVCMRIVSVSANACVCTRVGVRPCVASVRARVSVRALQLVCVSVVSFLAMCQSFLIRNVILCRRRATNPRCVNSTGHL